MKKGYSKLIKLIHFFGDILIINGSLLIACYIRFDKNPFIDLNEYYVSLFGVYNFIWILIVYMLKLYNIQRVSKMQVVLLHLLKSIALHAFIIGAYIFSIKGYYFSREHIFISYGILVILMVTWRFLFLKALRVYRGMGFNYRKVVIIGANPAGQQIYNYLKSNSYDGYKLDGIFDDEPNRIFPIDLYKGPVSNLYEYVKKESVDEIFCALPLTSVKIIRDLITLADNNMIRIKIVPDFRGFLNKKVNIDFYDPVPVMTIRNEPLQDIINRAAKRIFDVLFSSLVLILIFPLLFLVFAILIKLSSRGSVFFVQKRNGKNNIEFNCYKFRTMCINMDSDKKQAVEGDDRITGIGKFLRKSNLDELPQFWNVLIGNMSVIGPRPHMLKHTVEYSKIIDKFMVRQLVKPGITGWAQVHGFRGCTKQTRKMMKRVRYDVWYIENWSFLLDLKIVFLTVFSMVKGDKNAF